MGANSRFVDEVRLSNIYVNSNVELKCEMDVFKIYVLSYEFEVVVSFLVSMQYSLLAQSLLYDISF